MRQQVCLLTWAKRHFLMWLTFTTFTTFTTFNKKEFKAYRRKWFFFFFYIIIRSKCYINKLKVKNTQPTKKCAQSVFRKPCLYMSHQDSSMVVMSRLQLPPSATARLQNTGWANVEIQWNGACQGPWELMCCLNIKACKRSRVVWPWISASWDL